MFSTFPETVAYLYGNLPMFQRLGGAAYRKDLTNTIKLCAALHNPQNRFKTIHVAGTNGKGSTSHMLASVLQSAGYKTGLYTSPHLKSFTERIRINGEEIREQYVVDFVNQIDPLIKELNPSFFEITVAMAFQYFANEKVDIAVIEVGMGGRLDSTNIITPEISVITNIGRDHAEFLGDTLELIANEKAGIIKSQVPVVISERQHGIQDVFERVAKQKDSLLYYGDRFKASKLKSGYDLYQEGDLLFKNLQIPLLGDYQTKNIPGVLMALDILKKSEFHISEEAIQHGLENVIAQTRLKGRWQILGENPLIICDTGHNEDGIKQVVEQLKHTAYKNLHVVMGVVKDKAIEPILKLWPIEATYYFCEAKIPRALDANILYEKAKAIGLKGEAIKDVNAAIEKAKASADADDLIFIGGSTFVVADIENL